MKEVIGIKIDINRILKLLNSPNIIVPKNLCREEKRKFILKHSK